MAAMCSGGVPQGVSSRFFRGISNENIHVWNYLIPRRSTNKIKGLGMDA